MIKKNKSGIGMKAKKGYNDKKKDKKGGSSHHKLPSP
jgi:hypothetical protein